VAEEYCDLYDLPVNMCSHCRGLDPNPRVVDRGSDRHGPTIAARYTSPCPGCDTTVRAGDPLTLVDHTWVCAECA
jgi:hypothetical protein